ncbi:MAG TPA: hypothetical protein VF572_06915 [Candidatus Saccharimonadales bacterium]
MMSINVLTVILSVGLIVVGIIQGSYWLIGAGICFICSVYARLTMPLKYVLFALIPGTFCAMMSLMTYQV